jgi:hypothetical protein
MESAIKKLTANNKRILVGEIRSGARKPLFGYMPSWSAP